MRDIALNHKFKDAKYPPNIIKTQRYNWFTFLFMSILEQFKVFSNQYFLFISITQIFPELQINLAFTYYLPLVLVVAVSVIKDFCDDLARYRRDKRVNSQNYTLMGGQLIQSAKLQPGDIIILKKDERVPADVVVLQTQDPRGVIYIRTDNLDGEIDWKTRKSIPLLQKLEYVGGIPESRGIIQCGELSKEIYNFVGKYVHLTEFKRVTVPLNYENTIWQNCVVANSECVCCVINTGRDTRSAMNTSRPRVKTGRTDVQMNLYVKGLFVFLVVIAMVFTFCSASASGITFLRFFIIYSAIIPVSLKVCMELGKLLVSFGIGRDRNMKRVQVNSTSIPEQLGKITHIFSDKTGTLTKNVMKVQKIIYGETQACTGCEEVVKALIASATEMQDTQTVSSLDHMSGTASTTAKVVQYAEIRQQMYQIQAKKAQSLDPLTPKERLELLMQGMSVCHSVALQDGQLLASSPDEVALVKFAQDCNYELTYRDDALIKINGTYEYQVKYVFPFTSVTKRMGIVVYDVQKQKYYLFVKGADTVISGLLIQKYGWLHEKIDQLSSDGLRTLVFAYKELSNDIFNLFHQNYQDASCLLTNREQKQLELENQLFQQVFLLGITGVEDQLQDGVQKTLEMFRSAGIRTWILSGDKVQTIQCIALSSRLIDPSVTRFHVIEGEKNFFRAMEQLQLVGAGDCLVIDGTSLQTLLGSRPADYYLSHRLLSDQPEQLCPLSPRQKLGVRIKLAFRNYFTGHTQRSLGDEARNTFARITARLPAVCCCRCSPDQKALICKLISGYTQQETAGVGDGANDVSLLQAASIGFGIFGKEGVQAAMASDFAIGEFRDLQQLLFWHGRGSYKNTVECCQFIIQRGMCSSFIQAWFAAIMFFSPTTLFNGIQMLGYAAVYNILPAICMYFNEDVDYQVIMTYPELYKKLLKGRLLNARTFFLWNSVAMGLSLLILLTSLPIVNNRLDSLVLVSFTALSIDQLLLICMTVQRWSWAMVGTQVLSVIVYWVSLFIQLDSFPLDYILSAEYYWKSTVVTLASGGVLFAIQVLLRCFRPDEIAKLRFTQAQSTCCGCCKVCVHGKSSTGMRYFNL